MKHNHTSTLYPSQSHHVPGSRKLSGAKHFILCLLYTWHMFYINFHVVMFHHGMKSCILTEETGVRCV